MHHAKKVERLFSPRGHGGGTWLAGQRLAPADPGAGKLRLPEHRVGGRSLSVLRPDDQFRCKALAGCSGSSIHCLQGMAGAAAAPAHALLAHSTHSAKLALKVHVFIGTFSVSAGHLHTLSVKVTFSAARHWHFQCKCRRCTRT